MNEWTTRDIPPQQGRRVLITGATRGLGYETALAQAGADVLRSGVEAFANRLADEQEAIALLVNNAGVMAPPARRVTKDGFELQFATNHLGHFALADRFLPLLRKGRQTRIVSLSSRAHRLQPAIHFDDLQWEKSYRPWPAYAQSKLLMILFAFELQRRCDAFGWGLMSNAAHPGYAITDLQSSGPRMGRDGKPPLLERLGTLIEPFLAQSAADDALPSLFAATSPDAKRGGYYGPQHMFESKFPVGEAKIGKEARATAVATRLWDVAE